MEFVSFVCSSTIRETPFRLQDIGTPRLPVRCPVVRCCVHSPWGGRVMVWQEARGAQTNNPRHTRV
jgi:hypothetical protein